MRHRAVVIAVAGLLVSGCTGVTFVSPEYAARPVQPLNQQAALAEINAYRAANGLPSLVLDARLNRAASAHSADQARRGRMGHNGSDGSQPMDRAERAGYHPKIASENVAAGYKSFSDVMHAMSQSSDGRAYWTLVLGAEQ
jgi:uncharacterized protein YkwD